MPRGAVGPLISCDQSLSVFERVRPIRRQSLDTRPKEDRYLGMIGKEGGYRP